MLKKEVNETIKQTLIFLAIMIAAPLLILLVSRLFTSSLSYDQLFFSVFNMGILIFAPFMGISLFSRDMKDGGLEYLLTLPYSRLQLLGFKLIPRFIATAAVFGIYILLLFIAGFNPETANNMFVLPTGLLASTAFPLFIIGIPFSISRRGIVISALGTFLGFLIYLYLLYLVFPTALLLKGNDLFYGHESIYSNLPPPGYIYFFSILLLLGSLIAFIHAFKQFNLGPIRGFLKRYFKVFIPTFIIAAVISVAWAASQIWTPQDHYFLTDNHRLLETDYISTRVYDSENVTEADLGYVFWLDFSLEKDNYFYTISYTRYENRLVRLDLINPGKEAEVLYTAKGDSWLRELNAYGDYIAFFDVNRQGNKKSFTLVVLKPGTGVVYTIEIPFQERISSFYPKIFGADEIDGKRFWLIRFGYEKLNQLYRVWENGTIEDLGSTAWPPVYTKGLLITGSKNSIIFTQLTAEGMNIIKSQPIKKGFSLYAAMPHNLDQQPTKVVYGVVKRDKLFGKESVYRLDLETLEISEVTELRQTTGLIDYSHPDNWYYMEMAPGSTWRKSILKKLFRLSEGKPVLLKEFDSLEINRDKEFFDIFNTGMVIKDGGKTRVLSLPDLKEMPFKKLK